MKNAVVVTQYRNKENTVDFAVVNFDNEQHLVCLSTEKYIGEIGFDGCSIDGLIVCNNEITLDCNNHVNFLDLAIEAQSLWLAGLDPQKSYIIPVPKGDYDFDGSFNENILEMEVAYRFGKWCDMRWTDSVTGEYGEGTGNEIGIDFTSEDIISEA
jgi:hypothetical protein